MKNYFPKRAVLLFLALTFYPFNAVYAAPILITDGSGILLGADDVDVNGTLYDVRFVDGTCIDIYDGCDEQSDFPFTFVLGGGPSSQALTDQVFTGIYDLNPSLTFGCSFGTTYCLIQTAVGLNSATGPARIDAFQNYVDEGDDQVIFATRIINGPTSGPFATPGTDANFVTWTLATTIPEPGTGLLLLSAVVGLTFSRRKAYKARYQLK